MTPLCRRDGADFLFSQVLADFFSCRSELGREGSPGSFSFFGLEDVCGPKFRHYYDPSCRLQTQFPNVILPRTIRRLWFGESAPRPSSPCPLSSSSVVVFFFFFFFLRRCCGVSPPPPPPPEALFLDCGLFSPSIFLDGTTVFVDDETPSALVSIAAWRAFRPSPFFFFFRGLLGSDGAGFSLQARRLLFFFRSLVICARFFSSGRPFPLGGQGWVTKGSLLIDLLFPFRDFRFGVCVFPAHLRGTLQRRRLCGGTPSFPKISLPPSGARANGLGVRASKNDLSGGRRVSGCFQWLVDGFFFPRALVCRAPAFFFVLGVTWPFSAFTDLGLNCFLIPFFFFPYRKPLAGNFSVRNLF